MKRTTTIALVSACLLIVFGLFGCQGFPFQPTGKTVPAETPLFDPPAGAYNNAVDVTITSATGGALIYYATDSANPSDATATLYSGPVHLTSTVTVYAVAYQADLLPSLVAQATYTIEGTPEQNQPPAIKSPVLSGVLVQGQAGSLTVECVATDPDGTVQSVKADLSAINGDTAQPLDRGGNNTWTWAGTLTPKTLGNRTIRFTATDDRGAVVIVSVTASVQPYVPPAGTEKWRFGTGDWIWSSPAVASDGTIYVGSLDGKVYAVNPDGTEKWTFATGSYVYCSPSVGSDGTIYIGSRDFKFYALNPDGSEKWNRSCYADSSPAIAADGTIYVGSIPQSGETGTGRPTGESGPGILYALNPNNGSIEWEFPTDGSIWSSPAIAGDGTIYVGSRDYYLYAISPKTHKELWRFQTQDQVNASPAIGSNGMIYVGSMDGSLYAITPDGKEKWAFVTGGAVDSSPAIGPDGTIYVGSTDERLYAVTPDGSEKWRVATNGAITSSPAVDGNGIIYVGSRDGKIYAFNSDGSPKWTFATSADVTSSPVLATDGTLYVGSYDSHLYALRAGSPSASSSWPLFRHDAGHTARTPASQPVNQPPRFDSLAGEIRQVGRQPGVLTITCTVTDADDSVEEVSADLTPLGIDTTVLLSNDEGDEWSWSGSMPNVTGDVPQLYVTATDSRGEPTTNWVDITVTTTNTPPTISDVFVSGGLLKDVPNSLPISCKVVDAEGTVDLVQVDVSAVGGPADWQTMPTYGYDMYSWYSPVTPPTAGTVYITIRATDDMGTVSTLDVPVTVDTIPPPQVTVLSATTSPDPAATNRNAMVTITCSATPSGGRSITSVIADLTSLGGGSSQPMIQDTGVPSQWFISSNFLPSSSGTYTVPLMATDDAGQQGSADATITVVDTVTTGLPVAAGSNDEFRPAVSGDIVVWQEFLGTGWEIHAKDLQSGTEVPIGTIGSSRLAPAVDGNMVVWQDDRNGNDDVYGFQLPSGPEIAICTDPGIQAKPAVSGDIVVWQDYRNGNWDIYGYNLQTLVEFPICVAPGSQMSPRISGDTVVWEDNRSGDWDIYGYDLTLGVEFAICILSADARQPAIDGNLVVWTDYRSGESDVYGYDLTTRSEIPICIAPGQQGAPAVKGNLVVWEDSSSGPSDIYGRSLPDGSPFVIDASPGTQSNPAVTTVARSGGTYPGQHTIVVWEDNRSGNSDISGVDIVGLNVTGTP